MTSYDGDFAETCVHSSCNSGVYMIPSNSRGGTPRLPRQLIVLMRNLFFSTLLAFGLFMNEQGQASSQCWALGASLDSGWVDPWQQGNQMCGPTTAATMVYWWQNQSSLYGGNLSTIDQVLGVFNSHYNNTATHVNDALKWYMDRYHPTVEFSSLYNRYHVTFQSKQEISSTFRQLLGKGLLIGMATGAESPGLINLSHASTVWGAEFRDDGMLTSIWVADPGPGAEDNALEKYELEDCLNKDGTMGWSFIRTEQIQGGISKSYASPVYLYTLSPYTVPEPTGAFLEVISLSLIACRRRRIHR